MITNLKNVALVIKTADCIPIILYDNKTKTLAAIHSGWKGTLNSIVKEVLNKMLTTYNVDIKNIKAYLYPSIRKCHFEVEKDVYNMFKNKIKNIDKNTILICKILSLMI
jgi:YfiH family protein